MPSSIRRIDVAGRDVTEYMQLLFRKSGYVFHTSAEKEVVKMIKEKTGYVALDPKKEEKEWMQHVGRPDVKAMEYTLPDGNKMKVSCLDLGRLQDSKVSRSVRRDTAPLRFYSILRSLDLNIRVSIKSLLTQSIEQIWTFESLSSATSCYLEARRSPRDSGTDCCMKCKD